MITIEQHLKTIASTTIELASKHVDNGAVMQSSAQMCAMEAVRMYGKGVYAAAYREAKNSLKYSVGIFHADYRLANGG